MTIGDAAADQLPFVSVLMPVRNEAGYIERSLGSVLAQNYPATRMEILVVDGMSEDGTRDRVLALAEHDERIHLLDNPREIAPTALNVGLQAAHGEVLVRVDGHCEIEPDYVRRAVEILSQGEFGGVGGPIETVGETATARAIAAAMSHPFGVGGSAFRSRRERVEDVDTIAFPAYRRTVVARAGLYDEELVRNQDDEYNYRLRELGERLLLTPAMRSRYYSRGTLRRLWRQYFQYGWWKVRVLQKHRRQMRARQFIPPLFVALLVLGPALAWIAPVSAWVLLVIVGLYAGLCLSIAWVAGRRAGASWLRIVAAFALLHLGYGSGFLLGLGRFAGRWGDRRGRVPEWNGAGPTG
ncbi:MAG TPA: glycosyltransferase, partial [Thermoanaerobaculia bacterium]|nr:glycosyltransferase [Thermoanaerobaculia bacterium]